MRAFDDLPRLAELSLKAARQARTLALSVVRTVAETALRRRSSDQISGWTRRWDPPSSRPTGEPPPPPGAPRRPVATTPATPPVAATPTPPPPPPPAAAPEPAAAPPPAPSGSAPGPAAEPQHVDSDAVVVAESADAGAPDGAGAEVHVAEPWDGYSDLNVKDITKQLATASSATLAVVRLYESAHRNRRTVLAAVDRRLAAADR